MGTRADFYLAKQDTLEWLGSIALDGYCIDEADKDDVSANDIKNRTSIFLQVEIKNATNGDAYQSLVNEFIKSKDHGTLPDEGWPWPWNNSKLTDYTYLFANGRVWVMLDYQGKYEDHTTPCRFVPIHESEQEVVSEELILKVPDMSSVKNVQYGNKSGAIFISVKND